MVDRSKEPCDEPSVMGAGFGMAPMPTEADARKAYERLFKARIVTRLLAYGVMGDNSPWTTEAAQQAADDEWSAREPDIDLSDNPEDDADECLSYWDGDV